MDEEKKSKRISALLWIDLNGGCRYERDHVNQVARITDPHGGERAPYWFKATLYEDLREANLIEPSALGSDVCVLTDEATALIADRYSRAAKRAVVTEPELCDCQELARDLIANYAEWTEELTPIRGPGAWSYIDGHNFKPIVLGLRRIRDTPCKTSSAACARLTVYDALRDEAAELHALLNETPDRVARGVIDIPDDRIAEHGRRTVELLRNLAAIDPATKPASHLVSLKDVIDVLWATPAGDTEAVVAALNKRFGQSQEKSDV